MGNIADQFFAFFVKHHLLFRGQFQPFSHFLEILAKIIDLIHTAALHRKIQIPFFDAACGFFQLIQRRHHPLINP